MTLKHDRISSRKAAVFLTMILLLGFLLRLWIILPYSLGPNSFSDDNGYLTGGITFANTGYISYANADKQNTAICVGMPFTLGALFSLFGYTPMGLTAAHLAFSCISLLTAVGVYMMSDLLRSRFCGLIAAALCALEPSLASLSCVFLTETPYLCLNLFAMYFFLRCTREWNFGSFWAGIACMIAAALFKGLALMVVLTVIPIIVRRRLSVRKWLPKLGIGAVVFVLCFAPWWVRNFKLLNEFVPFTANRGDIQLLGSYIGVGYPEGTYDEMVVQLDAEAWIEGYQEDGERRFARRGEVGKERLAQWFSENPVGFLYSHVVYKPFVLITEHFQPIHVIPERLGYLLWWGCLVFALWGLICPRFGAAVKPDYYAPAFYLLLAIFVTAIYAPMPRYGTPYIPILLFYTGSGIGDLAGRLQKKLH